jgi:hypothetical protein
MPSPCDLLLSLSCNQKKITEFRNHGYDEDASEEYAWKSPSKAIKTKSTGTALVYLYYT